MNDISLEIHTENKPTNTHMLHGTGHIYLHFWFRFMINVGKYSIHGWYGTYYDILNLHCNSTGFFGILKQTQSLDAHRCPARIPAHSNMWKKIHDKHGFRS